MLSLRVILYVALGSVGASFSGLWIAHLARARHADAGAAELRPGRPRPAELGIGFVTNFFDTLGIGSFAPTTSLFRLLRAVPDQLIPGTLLVGHALPLIAQALIFIKIVEVDLRTLSLLVVASVVGAWLGAGLVARWPRRHVQLGMGSALLVAAAVMLAGLVGLVPSGGAALGLGGGRLAVGLAGNLLLGALMTIGIGAYAPSLILFALLGMNVRSIFPIMMSSCAFIAPIAGLRFVRRGSYASRAALGLALGGIPGVLIAAFLVKELPLAVLRWLVLAVVVYTALAMLRSAMKNPEPVPSSPVDAPGRGRP
jgi:uncharacterized membrane protein YfcA